MAETRLWLPWVEETAHMIYSEWIIDQSSAHLVIQIFALELNTPQHVTLSLLWFFFLQASI